MPSTVAIRRAGPEDAATVLGLVRELAAHQGEEQYVRGTAESWAGLLGRRDVLVLLAERDGEPAGYVSAVRKLSLWDGADFLALDDLYVRASARDGGIGRLLMLELARLASAEELLVRWEMHQGNTAAQRFYQRLGARLRTKVIAAWTVEAQRAALP